MTIPFKITLSKQKEGVQNWFIGPETGFKLKLRDVDFRGSVDTKAIWKASIKDIEPPSKTPLTCVRIAPVNFEEEVPQHALIGAVIFVDDAQNVRFCLSQIPNPSQPSGLRGWGGVGAMTAANLEFEQIHMNPYGYAVKVPVTGGEFTKSGKTTLGATYEVTLKVNATKE